MLLLLLTTVYYWYQLSQTLVLKYQLYYLFTKTGRENSWIYFKIKSVPKNNYLFTLLTRNLNGLYATHLLTHLFLKLLNVFWLQQLTNNNNNLIIRDRYLNYCIYYQCYLNCIHRRNLFVYCWKKFFTYCWIFHLMLKMLYSKCNAFFIPVNEIVYNVSIYFNILLLLLNNNNKRLLVSYI